MPLTPGNTALTVMTYNVGNGLADPGRLLRMLRGVAVDLIALQELGAAQAAVLSRALGDRFPYYVLVAAGFEGKGLFSRFPIREHEQLDLYPARPDLRAVVDVDGAALTIVVGHPPPPRLGRGGLAFQPAATAQIGRLANLTLDSAPAVLLGDFNLTPRHPYYARLCAAGLIDAFAAAGVGRGSTLPRRVGQSSRVRLPLGWISLLPLLRVDYIWHTSGIRAGAAWIGEDAGSDHLPVLARLMIGDGTLPLEVRADDVWS